MKKVEFYCDKCGAEIRDVVFTLTCYAEDITKGADMAATMAAAEQNIRQNTAHGAVHLCRACKDDITDGVFVV